ncbi:hypothetical protein BV25DRAFT_1914605 [Artomyces pyxidatus]|uniref:Uncharacterized protein n=1 Tax=Artomyces pyxidatus TaxID=48021 RepID=A0ACB8T6M2_9AGAM|nr:hypothetical protein BV25DRAFT_1914605 [Artomyces pyxidatus]
MSTRSFVVFQDEPSEPPPKTKEESSAPLSPSITPLSPLTTSLTTAEKENLHPVTGARAGTPSDSQTKKRKNSVLATKLHVPYVAKKHKESKELQTDSKKRKAPSSTSKVSGRKGAHSSSSKGAGGLSTLLLKVEELPKVEEEVDETTAEEERIAQADVDSKCYDLTVSPLADVSKAFEQVPVLPADGKDVALRILSPKKITTAEKVSTSSIVVKKPTSFSTPERKRIYAAFTFASPSPASKRFAAAHNSTLDMFGDIEFRP